MNLKEIYRFAFPDGTNVVVVDDEDGFHWGTLKTLLHEIVLTQGKAETRLPWDSVRFMAQDDFDLRDVRGPFPTEPEIMARIAVDIRKGLVEMSRQIQKAPAPRAPRQPYRTPARAQGTIRFGDPFELEGAFTLHNAGNDGPEHWGEESAETIVIEQPGRIALLWDLGTVFEMEAR
jgi:hypothetical protein